MIKVDETRVDPVEKMQRINNQLEIAKVLFSAALRKAVEACEEAKKELTKEKKKL